MQQRTPTRVAGQDWALTVRTLPGEEELCLRRLWELAKKSSVDSSLGAECVCVLRE